MAEETTKRKKRNPPTFQHYPANRAKKLKQTWVEAKKVKARWRAEKRKLLGSAPSHEAEGRVSDDAVAGIDEHEEVEREEGSSDNSDSSPIAVAEGNNQHNEGPRPSRKKEKIKYDAQVQKNRPRRHREAQPDDTPQQGTSGGTSSLRELARLAYSPTSLHSRKPGPMPRKRTRADGRVDSARGATAGPRGQPDMRLRMGVMLEKIKRDFV